eukprot:GHVQ01016914.1.p1 GENE.GHVQ01016914.1~~GHVQ01016914.1.p1  ORF type:complete len:146 (+),score=26.78 GHVQ01016914.1:344-781(+)
MDGLSVCRTDVCLCCDEGFCVAVPIHECVCVCVCVYDLAWVCVGVGACVFVCVPPGVCVCSVWVYACRCVCVCVCVCPCVLLYGFVCLFVCVCVSLTNVVPEYLHIYIHPYTSIFVGICMCETPCHMILSVFMVPSEMAVEFAVE